MGNSVEPSEALQKATEGVIEKLAEGSTNTERALATVQTIKEVVEIPNADNIVLVKFQSNNWKCIMKRDEAEVGRKVIYFEIDSVLPPLPIFEFMVRSKYRVKTMKLRGQISQGLAMPIELFDISPELSDATNVTAELHVRKYELPVKPMRAQTYTDNGKEFPVFIEKTDEERIQNLTDDELSTFLNRELVATKKIDGTSATYFIRDGVFGICSRNREVTDSKVGVYKEIAEKYGIEEKLRAYNMDIAIQGEIFGEGIQSNRCRIIGKEFRVFTIQILEGMTKLNQMEIASTIDALNQPSDIGEDLKSVDVVGRFIPNHFKSYDDVENFVMKKELNTPLKIEGVVLRDKSDASISYKIINPDYLLKHGE